jgi:hypothetical protein
MKGTSIRDANLGVIGQDASGNVKLAVVIWEIQ